MDAKGSRETTSSMALSMLSAVGVAYVLPSLWEVCTFEAQIARWSPRDLAKRYLALLRDHLNRSAVDDVN